MTFQEFKTALFGSMIFTTQQIELLWPDFEERNLLNWQDKGYITKIIRGYYIFSDYISKPREGLLLLISNTIYPPSYVSTEWALSHYGLIPEAVYKITAVATRKTNEFETTVGTFVYRTLKPQLFFGYTLVEFGMRSYQIAYMEKAILDFLYLNPHLQTAEAMHELRINSDELFRQLDQVRFERYLDAFENKELEKRARLFLQYWKEPIYDQY